MSNGTFNYTPTKECPECGERNAAATRVCDCGHEFYPSRAGEERGLRSYEGPRHVDLLKSKTETEESTVAECLPGGFEYFGRHQLGPNYWVYSAVSVAHNAGEPVTAPNLRQLMDKCWLLIHKPSKKK